ncbi:lysis protein [Sodalis sp. dw_96]|uniref:lysis protein n=1 Tax=Sodalis sp. dw_96 TaxID=2719794 RepID=UPI001BD350D3|nr:lysis protein [Sodalis sp. dw_96]
MAAIFLTLKTYWRLWAFLALMAVAFAGGWYIEGLRKDQDIATIQKASDVYKKAVDDAATAQLAQALAKQQSAEQAAADIDTKYHQDLANAKTQNDALRADIAAGKRKLQLHATCKTTGNSKSVSDPAGTVGGTDAATARLDDAAQRDYFTLIDRLGALTSQVSGLQSYIRNVCLQSATK